MIKNYLKIAYRNLTKYKFISFINLFGLTVGLTCCLLILTYILHELSYDKFQPNAERVYRLTRTFYNLQDGSVALNLATVAPPFAPLLKNDFSDIEEFTRIYGQGPTPVMFGEKMFNERNIAFADEHLFHFFSTPVVEGDAVNGLREPYSVMLTDEIARKYFGNEDALNKLIKINVSTSYTNFRVTGIFKPFPSNTHLHPDILMSFATLNDTTILGRNNLETGWGNNSFFTYIRLPNAASANRLRAAFPAFLDRHMSSVYTMAKPHVATSLGLQNITDIHLRSHTDYEAEENGDIKRVYIFSAIALFILLIACINYMNLSTARSTLRAKEIGIRKTVGARKNEIITQFLSESVLIAWVAMLIAFGATAALLPWLNRVSGQHLDINILLRPAVLSGMVLVPFVVGLLSGIYPAIFMSSFRPVLVLKGFLKSGNRGISFRQVLVTVQFAISIALIICTSIVFGQLGYMQKKSLGFDKEHIVTIPYSPALNDRFDAFRNDLMSNQNIRNAARSSRIPSGRLLDESDASFVNGDSVTPTNADIKFVMVDRDFTPTYGIKIIAGRAFSREFGLDTSSFLVNEAAVRTLGFKSPEQAIGKDFQYNGRKGKLAGVFSDFNFESMHQKIVPLILLLPDNPPYFNRISIKMSGSDVATTLAHIESTWRKFVPQTPYEYAFLDENFATLYSSEQRQQTLFSIFSCLAIFIGCLGLFGLSAFAISQRIREIGIRKVLGADVSTIVTLLSKDFVRLVALSAIIAIPAGWFFMSKWLEGFAYRISLGGHWWIFLAAAILAMVIALITISFQAIRAALANPVRSLRTE